MIELICPLDKKPLKKESMEYVCNHCNSTYPIQKGVIRFLNKEDEFYEGTYKNTINYIPRKDIWPYILPLWIVSNGYVWFTRKYVPAGANVLELGCASGVKYFGNRYNMIGLDLSFGSLTNISNIYSITLQANALEVIPLPDNSIDAVISSYFWEHLSEVDKKNTLIEIYRVLKPGGKIVFLFDVETNNPLLRKVKRKHPEFYTKAFLEQDGHLGYETLQKNCDLITNHSFKVIYKFGMEKTHLQSPSVYYKLAMLPSFSHIVYKFINKFTLTLLKPFLAILRLTDTMFKNLLPDNWSRIFLIVAKK